MGRGGGGGVAGSETADTAGIDYHSLVPYVLVKQWGESKNWRNEIPNCKLKGGAHRWTLELEAGWHSLTSSHGRFLQISQDESRISQLGIPQLVVAKWNAIIVTFLLELRVGVGVGSWQRPGDKWQVSPPGGVAGASPGSSVAARWKLSGDSSLDDGARQECVRWRRKGGGRGFNHWPKNRALSNIWLDWMSSSIWGPWLGNNYASLSRESVSHQLLNLLPTPCACLWLFQGAQTVNSISHEPLRCTDSTNVPNLRWMVRQRVWQTGTRLTWKHACVHNVLVCPATAVIYHFCDQSLNPPRLLEPIQPTTQQFLLLLSPPTLQWRCCVLTGDCFCHLSTLGLSSRGRFEWKENNPAQIVDRQSRWVKLVCAESHRGAGTLTENTQWLQPPCREFFFLKHLWILMKNQLQTVSVRITNLCQSSREVKKEDEKTAWAEEGKHAVAWIATPKEKTGGNYAICQVTVASVRVFCFLWLFQPFKALNYKPAFYFYFPIILMQHCNITHAMYSADWEIPLQM